MMRRPLKCVLHYDSYHDLKEKEVDEALEVMDAGLIREGYYRKLNAKIPIGGEKTRRRTYGWGEHVSRKYGSAFKHIHGMMAEILRKRGMRVIM